MPRFFIFDFDSTLIQSESLEVLAEIALSNELDREETLESIRDITNKAMSGEMDYHAALKARFSTLNLNRQHLEQSIERLKTDLTCSFLKHKAFFKQYQESIYVISGSFEEFIWPVVEPLGILQSHIYANRFLFDLEGQIIGYDKERLLSTDKGKGEQLKALRLPGECLIIGDGYNDLLMKEIGGAEQFCVLTENVERQTVIEKADFTAKTFDEILNHYQIPVSEISVRPKALLLENIHPEAVRELEAQEFEVERVEEALEAKPLMEKLSGVQYLGLRSKTKVTREILDKADDLLAIGAFCIGTNQIDLVACQEKGIAVFNAPYSNSRSVVELAIGLMICLMRNVFDKSVQMHKGQWNKSSAGAYELRGKTLGIIGYGNIGSQLSVLAESLGLRVYYFDIEEKAPIGNAKCCESMTSLLNHVDIVSVHVDGKPENTQLINEQVFKQMKPGAIFLNLSRGDVVDIEALTQALESEKLRGAAIDVFPEEPSKQGSKFKSRLQNQKNVILTPHIGGSTQEAQHNIGAFVSQHLAQYHQRGVTVSSVNFPNIQLPALTGSHRIIHIHKNVPGILAKLNQFFAEEKINIEGQYLKTNEHLGYVITDVTHDLSKEQVQQLYQIENTIQVRLLY